MPEFSPSPSSSRSSRSSLQMEQVPAHSAFRDSTRRKSDFEEKNVRVVSPGSPGGGGRGGGGGSAAALASSAHSQQTGHGNSMTLMSGSESLAFVCIEDDDSGSRGTPQRKDMSRYGSKLGGASCLSCTDSLQFQEIDGDTAASGLHVSKGPSVSGWGQQSGVALTPRPKGSARRESEGGQSRLMGTLRSLSCGESIQFQEMDDGDTHRDDTEHKSHPSSSTQSILFREAGASVAASVTSPTPVHSAVSPLRRPSGEQPELHTVRTMPAYPPLKSSVPPVAAAKHFAGGLRSSRGSETDEQWKTDREKGWHVSVSASPKRDSGEFGPPQKSPTQQKGSASPERGRGQGFLESARALREVDRARASAAKVGARVPVPGDLVLPLAGGSESFGGLSQNGKEGWRLPRGQTAEVVRVLGERFDLRNKEGKIVAGLYVARWRLANGDHLLSHKPSDQRAPFVVGTQKSIVGTFPAPAPLAERKGAKIEAPPKLMDWQHRQKVEKAEKDRTKAPSPPARPGGGLKSVRDTINSRSDSVGRLRAENEHLSRLVADLRVRLSRFDDCDNVAPTPRSSPRYSPRRHSPRAHSPPASPRGVDGGGDQDSGRGPQDPEPTRPPWAMFAHTTRPVAARPVAARPVVRPTNRTSPAQGGRGVVNGTRNPTPSGRTAPPRPRTDHARPRPSSAPVRRTRASPPPSRAGSGDGRPRVTPLRRSLQSRLPAARIRGGERKHPGPTVTRPRLRESSPPRGANSNEAVVVRGPTRAAIDSRPRVLFRVREEASLSSPTRFERSSSAPQGGGRMSPRSMVSSRSAVPSIPERPRLDQAPRFPGPLLIDDTGVNALRNRIRRLEDLQRQLRDAAGLPNPTQAPAPPP
eukprot:Hpha_TRINITY_DN22882_c0_g1::TRINITY_DN22882_c0_g1_i1::g.84296::m.84296